MAITQLDNAPRCQHIRLSGARCKSPARTGTNYCLLHAAEHVENFQFTYPTIEDAQSIQFALCDVLQALRRGAIEYRAAALMLYALQIASGNLKRLELESGPPTKLKPELHEDDEALAIKVIQRLDQIDAERAAREGRPVPTPSPIEECRALGRLHELLLKRLDVPTPPEDESATEPSAETKPSVQ